jgi:hypothetical protein
MRKSFESPCPMNIHPRSTSTLSFLYTSFKGVNVYRDRCGSRSPTVTISARKKKRWTTLTFDTRKLSQIINNDLARMDMIINERDTFFRTIAPKDGHASKTKPCRADDTVGTI